MSAFTVIIINVISVSAFQQNNSTDWNVAIVEGQGSSGYPDNYYNDSGYPNELIDDDLQEEEELEDEKLHESESKEFYNDR